MRILARVLALALACGAFVAITACNTTKGVGQDLEAAGDAIEDTAKDTGARP